MRPHPDGREPFLFEVVLALDDVPADRYPFSIPAIRKLGALTLHPAVTFLIGENGSGKSTLMEAIAVRLGFDEVGGEKGAGFDHRAPDGGLYDAIRLVASRTRRPADRFFLRAETVFQLADTLDRKEAEDPSALDWYGERSLHTRSHGEAFLAIVQNRLRRESLFLLDEPEAALSPSRQLTLLKEIDGLVRGGCQFVIATHSPILMAYPDARIYELNDDGIRETTWRETDHYRITKGFLAHPQAFLRHLVG